MNQTEKEELEKNESHEEQVEQAAHTEEQPLAESSEDVKAAAMEEEKPLPADEESLEKDGEDREALNKDEETSLKRGKERKYHQQHAQEEFEKLQQEIAKEESVDEKLRIAVENMEGYLAQGGTPLFKYFWELRKSCLELFKENVSPAARAIYWPKYSHLSKEARRLKEMFDEQSAFAVEQIDIAISAMENEIENFEEALQQQPDIDFKAESKFFERKRAFYNDIQKRLNALNAHAARINNLRKELMKTDMRIKHKNKFFKRLSVAGDRVFPVRKELIKKISDQFISDVEYFLTQNFFSEQAKGSLFYLRQEIKSLQGIAKILTLNTHSFTSTRLRLSESWDKLKVMEKEKKKEYAEKKDIYHKNKCEVEEEIVSIDEGFDKGELSIGNSLKLLDKLQGKMKKVELGRDEVKSLKDSIAKVERKIEQKKNAEEEARQSEERENLRKKRELLDGIKEEIEKICENTELVTGEEIAEKQKQIEEKIAEIKDLTGREKLEIERAMRHFKDILNAKREEALLNLSDDDQNALHNLMEVLEQRRARRKEIKQHYDSLRKASGSSGFDFEQAMIHQDLLTAEKERLDLADEGIAEIERKIVEIKSKI